MCVMQNALHKKQDLQKPRSGNESLWENLERCIEERTFKLNLEE